MQVSFQFFPRRDAPEHFPAESLLPFPLVGLRTWQEQRDSHQASHDFPRCLPTSSLGPEESVADKVLQKQMVSIQPSKI